MVEITINPIIGLFTQTIMMNAGGMVIIVPRNSILLVNLMAGVATIGQRKKLE